jgi:hypothetical protein
MLSSSLGFYLDHIFACKDFSSRDNNVLAAILVNKLLKVLADPFVILEVKAEYWLSLSCSMLRHRELLFSSVSTPP